MYEHWQEGTLTDFSDTSIESKYKSGFVFTRLGRGTMHQIESVRVNLDAFELSSENRRILKKIDQLVLEIEELPLNNYSWEIGKMAKDFYDAKGGPRTMSANKVKEMFTDRDKSNMNMVFRFSHPLQGGTKGGAVGYCLAMQTKKMLHYSYPFYNLNPLTSGARRQAYNLPNIGMGMMLKAIIWAKEQGKEYIYLGTRQKYKEQFKAAEYFNKSEWVKL